MNRELDQKDGCKQLNFGGIQRNAGRDYIEYFAAKYHRVVLRSENKINIYIFVGAAKAALTITAFYPSYLVTVP